MRRHGSGIKSKLTLNLDVSALSILLYNTSTSINNEGSCVETSTQMSRTCICGTCVALPSCSFVPGPMLSYSSKLLVLPGECFLTLFSSDEEIFVSEGVFDAHSKSK